MLEAVKLFICCLEVLKPTEFLNKAAIVRGDMLFSYKVPNPVIDPHVFILRFTLSMSALTRPNTDTRTKTASHRAFTALDFSRQNT